MKLRIHPEAIRELDTAITWYGKGAYSLLKGYKMKCSPLPSVPWPTQKSFLSFLPAAVKHFYKKFPFKIIFEWAPDCIDIIAIAHAKRKTMYWRERQMPL